MADIFIGDGSAGKVFVGTSEVSKVFVGNTQVWPSAVSITISGTITDSVDHATIASPLTYSVTGTAGSSVSFTKTINANNNYVHGTYTENSSIWSMSRSGNTLTFTYNIPASQTTNITNNFTVDGAAFVPVYTATLNIVDNVIGKANSTISSDLTDTGSEGDSYSLFYYRTPNTDYEWSGGAPSSISYNGSFVDSDVTFYNTYTGTIVESEYSGDIIITSADDNVTVINVSPSTYSDLTYDTAVTVDYDLRANTGYEFEDGQTLITGNSVVLRVPSGGGDLTYEDQTLAELTGYEVTLSVVNNISGPEAGYNIKGSTQSATGSYGQSWSFNVPTVTLNTDYTADVAIAVTPNTAFSGTFGDGTDSVSHTITGTVSATEYSGTVSLTAQDNTSISITGGNTFSNLNVGDTHTVTFTITADDGYQFDDGETEKTGQTIDLTVASGGSVSGTVSGYTLEQGTYSVTGTATATLTNCTISVDGDTTAPYEVSETRTLSNGGTFNIVVTPEEGYEFTDVNDVSLGSLNTFTEQSRSLSGGVITIIMSYPSGSSDVDDDFTVGASASAKQFTTTINLTDSISNATLEDVDGNTITSISRTGDTGTSEIVSVYVNPDDSYGYSDASTIVVSESSDLISHTSSLIGIDGRVNVKLYVTIGTSNQTASATLTGNPLAFSTITVNATDNISNASLSKSSITYSGVPGSQSGQLFIRTVVDSDYGYLSADDLTVSETSDLVEVSSKTLVINGNVNVAFILTAPSSGSSTVDVTFSGEPDEDTYSTSVSFLESGNFSEEDVDGNFILSVTTTGIDDFTQDMDIYFDPSFRYEFTSASQVTVTDGDTYTAGTPTLEDDGRIKVPFTFRVDKDSSLETAVYSVSPSAIEYTYTLDVDDNISQATAQDSGGNILSSISITATADVAGSEEVYISPNDGYSYSSASDITTSFNFNTSVLSIDEGTLESDGRVKFVVTLTSPSLNSTFYDVEFSGEPQAD